MSRMMAPEMEVVRFKEADVIVASGGVPTLSFSNYGNGNISDNSANLSGANSGNGSYNLGNKNNVNAFLAALSGAELGDGGLGFVNGSRADDDDETYFVYNGSYTYQNGTWKQ